MQYLNTSMQRVDTFVQKLNIIISRKDVIVVEKTMVGSEKNHVQNQIQQSHISYKPKKQRNKQTCVFLYTATKIWS